MTEKEKVEKANFPPKGGERKYFKLSTDFSLKSAPFAEWLNEAHQMNDFVPASEKPFRGIKIDSPPQIKFDRKGRRGALRDACPITLGTWLVSERLKLLFESLDPGACAFQQAEVDYSNFAEPGPNYWFCYFMRELDCVDEQHSEIVYQDNISWKNYLGLIDIKMKPGSVGSAHAFRLKYASLELIVDDVVVDALKANKISGIEFVPIQK